MVPTNLYRLNEYQISEFADGRLWWDTHSGFGTQIGGPCFVCGNILVVGARCNEENGFLILEFSSQLKKLPLWNRTLYYCFASALLDIDTGRNISEERLRQMVSLAGMASTESKSITRNQLETFRLGQYKISIKPDGNISWMACGGVNQIVSGPVLIESDVLFIGPKKYDNLQQSKKEFLQTLQALPKWNRTAFWCRSLALKPVLQCEEKKLTLSLHKNKKILQQKIMPAKNHRSVYAKQVWSQMTGFCADWVEEAKARWPKRNWIKRKKNREAGNKFIN